MMRNLPSMLVAWLAVLLAQPGPAVGAELVHQVQPGESPSSVARQYYGGFEHTELLLLYNGKQGAMIRPGETLRVPYCRVHVVRAGDTWSQISQRYLERASDYEAIARLNGLEPASPLRVGARIVMPPPGAV